MRLIDADALPVSKEYCVDEAGFGASFNVVHKSDIDNAPTVDAVEVVHGKWYHGIEKCGSVYAKCSACGRKMNYSCYGYAYCALCGARMDGKMKVSE